MVALVPRVSFTRTVRIGGLHAAGAAAANEKHGNWGGCGRDSLLMIDFFYP